MDIKHLRYFVAMAEAGSLMKASERLRVAQPALSVHLSNLEIELGVQLVERSHRGISLTEQGQILYDRATALLKYHSEAILSLKRDKSEPAGSVSLALPSTMPGLFAPYLYKAMRKALPEVSFYMLDASSAALYEWLQSGKVDFAVLFNIPEDAKLSLSPVLVEGFCLAGQFEEGEDGDDILFDKVFEYPLVLPCCSSSWRKILEEQAERHGKSFSVTFETESFNALRSLAQSGECYTILPESSILNDRMNGALQGRKIVEPEMHGVYSLANLHSGELNQAQKAARELIITTFREVAEMLRLESPGPLSSRVYPSSLFPFRGSLARTAR